MKICVFGAGAVGGNVAARLARSGNQVSVVARGEHLAAIQASGLVVHAGEDRIIERVAASDRPADLGIQDIVISTLKANSLHGLARGIAPLLGSHTAVVFAQNGIPWWYPMYAPHSDVPYPDLSSLDPGGALATAIPRDSVLAAVVYSANTVTAPGVIVNSSPVQNSISIANIRDSSSDDRVAALRETLAASGIRSPDVADIRQEIWQKLVSNIVTGTTILVEEPTNTMLADLSLRRLAERLVSEVVATAAAYGIVVQPRLPDVPAGKKSSILQDFEQARSMEIDAQFLAPLAFARRAGIDCPVLELAAAVIAHRAAVRGQYVRPAPDWDAGRS